MTTVANALRALTLLLPWLIMLGLAASLALYVPWARLQDVGAVALATVTGAAVAAIIGMMLVRRLDGLSTAVAPRLDRMSARLAVPLAAACAALAGAVYVLAVPTWPLTSDAATYQALAKGLATHGTYSVEHNGGAVLKAFRPPGYPLALVPLAAVDALSTWVVLVQNALFLAAAAAFAYCLGRDLFGRATGLLAAVILCSSPALILGLGVSMPGPLTVMLMTGAAWGWTRLLDDERWLRRALLAGLFTGLLALVKPAFMLWPTAWFLMLLMRRGSLRRDAVRFLTCCLLVAATMAPWTIRNAVVLDAFVPVSSNGGSVFYRANNPWATGGFTERGERDLDAFVHDEVLWNRTGMQWGLEYIRENPVRFLELVLHKQRIFLAEDDFSAWFTYSRWIGDETAPGERHPAVGAALQAASNGWWIALWFMVALGLIRQRGEWLSDPRKAAVLWSVIFLVVVHSVFESQPRYHAPLTGLLAVAAGTALRPRLVASAVSPEVPVKIGA